MMSSSSAAATPPSAPRCRRANKAPACWCLSARPEDKRGGNSAYTGGGFRMVHHGTEDIKKVVPDLTDDEIARSDFGQYTAEDYLDDLGRITQYYIDPDLAETIVRNSFDTVLVDARPRRALHAQLRAPGLQRQRPLQIFRRHRHLRQRRRRRSDGTALQVARQTRHPGAIRRAGDRNRARRAGRRGRARALRRRRIGDSRARGGARLRRLRGQPRNAHALSRSRLGHRQGARHPLQHRRRHPHGARHRRAIRTASGPAATRSRGNVTPPISATSNTRMPATATAIRSASWSMPKASASSTKAPTSATTPTPNTAASCCSSRAASPGRSSTSRSST